MTEEKRDGEMDDNLKRRLAVVIDMLEPGAADAVREVLVTLEAAEERARTAEAECERLRREYMIARLVGAMQFRAWELGEWKRSKERMETIIVSVGRWWRKTQGGNQEEVVLAEERAAITAEEGVKP
jgi:hypothetical protein